MNYRPMMEVEGKWTANQVVFATEAEALANAKDLMNRWFAVTNVRADATDEPANYTYTNGQLERIIANG